MHYCTQGQKKDFLIGGPIDIVYRINMGVILPIRTANSEFLWEFWAHAPPGKFLRLKFSEVY